MGVALKKRSRMALILAAVSFLSLVTLLYANSSSRVSASPSLIYSFEIVREFPHDETAFTQGLLYGGNDTFYESTGLYGKSSVRRVHLQTGKLRTFTHHMKDGWGLATDGNIIFGSDGTSTLYKLDANTLKGIGETTVKYNDIEILYLNELEYINGEVWANIWMGIDVLNGIAWDAQQKRLFVTGKLWPKLYEIKLQPLKEHYEDIVNVCQLRKAGNAY
ncbi:Glutaminyl-peptide cyclotransferase [Nymphaea thermarum]|nr:Glutaminyl-peptide cyclotransferase [Nymphaea thermarum]